MKKNLLEVGNKVEFVQDGLFEEGVLAEKEVYFAKITVPNVDGSEGTQVVDVPYKNIVEIQ